MQSLKLTRLSYVLASVGLLTAGAALAQTSDAPVQISDAPAEVAPKSKGITEVVVTAQKIAQPASKTPIALTVLGGEDLKAAGVTDARALTSTIPNVQIAQASATLEVSIRGVRSQDTSPKGDPSAAFNVDGAYVSRPEAQSGAFFDIDRIEVLRGPQGTLYGRNATAGAINVITSKPEHKFGGSVSVELGNYGTRRVDGAFNIPVNDVLALRAAVSVNRHDTYLNPGPNTDIPLDSQDNRAARLHALATFTKDTSLLLTAEVSKMGGGGGSPVPITNFFTGTPIGTLPFTAPGRGNNIQDPVYVDLGSDVQRTTAWRFHGGAHRDNKSESLRGEYKTMLGSVGVTYQLARLNLDVDDQQNGVYFGFPFTSGGVGSSTSTSHELRFNSTGTGPLRWVAGLYAFDETVDRVLDYYTYVTAPFGPLTIHVPFIPHVENKSRAAFGQLTYNLRNDTRLTLGLRRTVDDKSGSDPLGGISAPAGASKSAGAYDIAVKFTNNSWKLGIDHDLVKNVMVYGSVATGYKAGGFNDTVEGGSYAPENLKAFEVGVKGRFLENMLQVTANVFHYDYNNLQLTSLICPKNDPTSCGSKTTNASNAKIDGAELEGTAKFGDDGILRANVGLTRTKFERYLPTATADWSGQNLDRAPAHTIGLGYTHHFPMGNGAEITAGVDTQLTGSYLISDPSALVRYRQPASRKSNLLLGYTTADGNTSIQVFAKNLEDEITIQSRVPGAFFIGDPRTYGARLNYRF